MADKGMIMRAHAIRSALRLGLALAVAGMGQVPMSHAQTALATQAPIEDETLFDTGTSLRAQYPAMVHMGGMILVFGPSGAANAVAERWGRFVLYAPLNRLWLLDDETDAIAEHAYIEVKQTPFDHLVLHWMQWRDRDIADVLPAAALMPAFTVESTTRHPLATQYDALLTKPLAQSFDPLPAGAYFSAGGHVFDADGAQIAEWDSYGAEIAMRLIPVEASAEPAAENPLWQWFSVADLAAALNPKPPQGDQ